MLLTSSIIINEIYCVLGFEPCSLVAVYVNLQGFISIVRTSVFTFFLDSWFRAL